MNGAMGGRSLDAAKYEAAFVGFHTSFNNRMKRVEPIWRRLATVVETDNVVDRQLWLSNVPKMRRWVGPKQIAKLRAESHLITTEPHEASIEVSKHDILNDRLGMYSERIGQMALGYNWALDDLVITMMAAGVAGTSLGTTYDGQNLIDTDHTVASGGGTAQSNKVTGALTAAKYAEAWGKFLAIKDENEIPVNAAGSRMTLVVGPANREIARTILEQEVGATGAQNIDAGSANLIVTPWISARTTTVLGVSVTLTGTEWFLVPENSNAIIVHVKRGPEFLSVEEGEFVFRTAKFLYGIEAEFGAGYGLWQEIVGGPGA